MKAFEYASPTTKEQAVSLLGNQWGETEILAGGTDLLSLMKEYLSTPKRVVNVKEIKEFQGIRYSPGAGLRLGALVTLEELMDHAAVKKEYPALAQAAEGVRSQQIRNSGTVGGDLCQRPRCWYFRNGFGYFPKGEGGEDLVINGENQYHAILGNSGPAYFVNPSSLAPGLIALNAKIRLFGAQGWREVEAEQFFVTPNLRTSTIEMAKRYSKPIMPGALTPTEVLTAWEAGADAVKIFPCSAVGGAKRCGGTPVLAHRARCTRAGVLRVRWSFESGRADAERR